MMAAQSGNSLDIPIRPIRFYTFTGILEELVHLNSIALYQPIGLGSIHEPILTLEYGIREFYDDIATELKHKKHRLL